MPACKICGNNYMVGILSRQVGVCHRCEYLNLRKPYYEPMEIDVKSIPDDNLWSGKAWQAIVEYNGHKEVLKRR